jgi:hypothetical protein
MNHLFLISYYFKIVSKAEKSRLVDSGRPPPADSGNLAVVGDILRVPIRGIDAVALLAY